MELYRGKKGTLEARVPKNFPFEICYREGLGRCLFATREIRPEETVLTDSAILLGSYTHTHTQQSIIPFNTFHVSLLGIMGFFRTSL